MKSLFILGLALLSTSAKAETALTPIDTFDLNFVIHASLPGNTESAVACVETTYSLREQNASDDGKSDLYYHTEYTIDGEHCSQLSKVSLAGSRSRWSGQVSHTEVLFSENIFDNTYTRLDQYRVKIKIRTVDGLEYTSFGTEVGSEAKERLSANLSFTDRDGALVGGT